MVELPSIPPRREGAGDTPPDAICCYFLSMKTVEMVCSIRK